MIISAKNAWDAARQEHLNYVKSLLPHKPIHSPTAGHATFIKFMASHLDDIAIAPPARLRELIEIADSAIGIGTKFTRKELNDNFELAKKNDALALGSPEEIHAWDFNAAARKLLNYTTFSNKNVSRWNAYSLCRRFSIRLCPYCQQAFAFTFQTSPTEAGFRPPLDHFYPKSVYPYLAVSLYNLIPSCQVCNSSLKLDSDFYSVPHLHPFEDEEEISFRLDPKIYWERKRSGMGMLHVIVDESKALRQKAANSCNTFLLRERYRFNDVEITQWIDSLQNTPQEKIHDFAKKQGISNDRSERILLQFDRTNYQNEILGKLKKDLLEIEWE